MGKMTAIFFILICISAPKADPLNDEFTKLRARMAALESLQGLDVVYKAASEDWGISVCTYPKAALTGSVKLTKTEAAGLAQLLRPRLEAEMRRVGLSP